MIRHLNFQHIHSRAFIKAWKQLAWLFLGIYCSSSTGSNINVELKASEKADANSLGHIELYQESYALVIGNDNYNNGWPRLSNAVNDATTIANELTLQGYQVALKTNLNAEQLKKALRNFFILRGQSPNARLLLWYAGHGQTIKGEGFLVATDTPASNSPEFKLSAIHMRDFGSWVRLAESKHVLAIFDSCFAGTIFTSQRGAPPASITMATTYPVRQFITSGDADQLVLDNGAFRELFIRALKGEERADINGDGYLTASELGFYLSDRVTNLTQANQTPRYGKLRDKDYDRGDFILAVLKEQKNIMGQSLKVQATETENLMWQSVTNLNTEAGFQQYLNRYPRGTFTDLAHLQIKKIKQKSSPTTLTKPVRSPSKSYQLKQNIKIVYATKDITGKKKPFYNAATITVFRHGEKINVVASVSGLKEHWLQVLFNGEEIFIRNAEVSPSPPRKSMAELIMEQKVQLGVNTNQGVLDYRKKQCLKTCDNNSYLHINSTAMEKIKTTCSLTDDTYAYDNCLKLAKASWQKALLSSCQAQCK